MNHQDTIDQAIEDWLASVSIPVLEAAKNIIPLLAIEGKEALLNDIASVPRRLNQLLVTAMCIFPVTVWRLLIHFGGTLRAMYEGLRAVNCCRPGL